MSFIYLLQERKKLIFAKGLLWAKHLLGVLHTFCHLILMATLKGRYHCPHFTGEETEIQSGYDLLKFTAVGHDRPEIEIQVF